MRVSAMRVLDPDAPSAVTGRAPRKPRSGSSLRGVGDETGEAGAETGLRPRRSRRNVSTASSSVIPPGSGMNDATSVFVEAVEVERDVDAVDLARARASTASLPVWMPAAAMNSRSGGSRSRAPSSATCAGSTAPASRIIRSGMPHSLPDGELSGVFRSPCASTQTTASRSWRVASPSTAPTCEQQQPPRTSGRSGSSEARASICSASVSSATTAASGYGSSVNAASAIASPPFAPGARHADEPGGELAAAGVALVLGARAPPR